MFWTIVGAILFVIFLPLIIYVGIWLLGAALAIAVVAAPAIAYALTDNPDWLAWYVVAIIVLVGIAVVAWAQEWQHGRQVDRRSDELIARVKAEVAESLTTDVDECKPGSPKERVEPYFGGTN